MKFIAEINVMPLKALLDPQGKAVTSTIHNIGYKTVDNVRVGKHITMEVEAASKEEAMSIVNDVCSKVLHNPIMEGFDYVLEEVN